MMKCNVCGEPSLTRPCGDCAHVLTESIKSYDKVADHVKILFDLTNDEDAELFMIAALGKLDFVLPGEITFRNRRELRDFIDASMEEE